MVALSIVHGARIPFANKEASRRWAGSLREYLRAKNLGPVEVFNWSGGFFRAFGRSTHLSYVEHLDGLWREAQARGLPLCVLSKSQGSFVVEGALRNIGRGQSAVQVALLIRVATADPRTDIEIPGVQRIIDIYSEDDTLVNRGYALNRLMLKNETLPSRREIAKFAIEGLSHHDFNYDKAIQAAGRETSMYAFYYELLQSAGTKFL